ncbi:hypothetical protein HZI73_05620 [Vallitalea pronyensis]|uniref:Uncharacterized protein n=1 Tax=Vallitalea pronyensis TaxID=1348613 RepID=A0A8J8MHN7_9FIRM|nr:hypothetical protein [Vallitalea pronyensis]QUI21804.1 hypothetical protein HZI73_05620 [Vallitalea pronyensis]
MKVTKSDFAHVKSYMYRHARPIEIARWKVHFENGSKEDFMDVLQHYQNEDGGIGNALEADSWNPHSTPYTTSYAIRLLNEINFTDKSHPMIMRILSYLENTPHYTDGYWSALIPTNNDYPHAPWWQYESQDQVKEWGYNPTARLAGFIIAFADEGSKLYKEARTIAGKAIDQYLYGVTSDGTAYKDYSKEGEVRCYLYLIQCLENANIANQYNTEELKPILQQQVQKFIERDTSKWAEYCQKPSHFIDSPDSVVYVGNEDIMDKELDYIINKRNKDGVWDIVWRWNAYPDAFEVSKNWWKSCIIIENMLLLKKFGRLDG